LSGLSVYSQSAQQCYRKQDRRRDDELQQRSISLRVVLHLR